MLMYYTWTRVTRVNGQLDIKRSPAILTCHYFYNIIHKISRRMQVSTISVYQKYLNYHKIFGIFPYILEYRNDAAQDFNSRVSNTKFNTFGEENKTLSSVRFHTRGFFAIWHCIVFGFFYIYFIFQITRFVERFMGGSGAIELFGMSCWIWKPIFVATFVLHYHRKREAISDLKTNWHRVESNIYQEWSFTLPSKINDAYKQIIWGRRFAYVYVPIWMVLILSWMTLSHLDTPTFPAYISSFIGNPLNPEKFAWLFYVSVPVQILALIPILLTFDHFYILCLTFSKSVSRVLVLITDPFQSPEEEKMLMLSGSKSVVCDEKINLNLDKEMFHVSRFVLPSENNVIIKLQFAMNHFAKIEKLTKQFNLLYRWMLFVYQAVILVNFCILIFVPLRFSKIFGWTGLIVFFVSFLFFMFHISTLLPAMGAVAGHSLEFQRIWERRLARVSHTIQLSHFLQLKSELDSCLPFGFQTGTFYTLNPGSLLVFFSIATSYLIVLLQLDINY